MRLARRYVNFGIGAKRADVEPAAARRHYLGCCAQHRSLVPGIHPAHPAASHVVPAGAVWRFEVE
jgi:hypothetical protein